MQMELDDVDGRDVGSRYRWICFPWSFMEIMGINMMMCPANCLDEETTERRQGVRGVEVAVAMVIREKRCENEK